MDKTILVMFPVSNDLKVGRYEMDRMSDNDAFKYLWEHRDDLDAVFYNMSSSSFSDPLGQAGLLNASEFEDDYNDEEYDGGFWTKVMILDEELIKKTIG